MNHRAAGGSGWRVALASIRGKLALLGTLALLAIIVVSLIELFTLHRMLSRVEAEDTSHRVARARRSLEQLAQHKASTIMEFAIWDEAYDFASHPGAPRFATFLRDNYTSWLPSRYGDRVIRIWNRKHDPLLNWSDPGEADLDLWFPSEELIATAERLRTFGGFVATPRGLFLVGFSVILRVSDDLATGQSNGYVLTGQPVDSTMVRELGKDLQESVRILPTSERVAVDSMASSIVAGGDSISIRFPLVGVNGEEIGVVELRDTRAEMRRMYSFAFGIMAATLLGGTLVMVVLWLAMKRMVILPLGDFSADLKAMQQAGEMRSLESAHPASEWQLFARAFNGAVMALALSEERYQVLFRQAVDAYILIDSFSKTILEANPAAETLAGCTEDDMVGHPLAAIFDFSSSPEQAGAFTMRRPDGGSSTVGVVTSEIELGGISRTLVSVRDLSQYEKTQTQLRQAQRMDAIGSLAGAVAHDFNNLLGAILVANSSLRADLADHADVAEPLETIDQAARRASELTRQLLRLARREQPRNVPLALNEVVQPVGAVRGTERILVIDDDASLRSAMCRSLKRLGYSVVGAESGREGIKAVEQDQAGFDLVLLDVVMPDLNGVETFKQLRLVQPDIQVLVCSGYTAEDMRQQLLNAGAKAFLSKPFDIADLSQAVREALARVTVSNP